MKALEVYAAAQAILTELSAQDAFAFQPDIARLRKLIRILEANKAHKSAATISDLNESLTAQGYPDYLIRAIQAGTIMYEGWDFLYTVNGYCPECEEKLDEFTGSCDPCHLIPALNPDYQKWLEI